MAQRAADRTGALQRSAEHLGFNRVMGSGGWRGRCVEKQVLRCRQRAAPLPPLPTTADFLDAALQPFNHLIAKDTAGRSSQ